MQAAHNTLKYSRFSEELGTGSMLKQVIDQHCVIIKQENQQYEMLTTLKRHSLNGPTGFTFKDPVINHLRSYQESEEDLREAQEAQEREDHN